LTEGCLYIGDEIRDVPAKYRPKIFDPTKHPLNAPDGISKQEARRLARLMYEAASAKEESTLTERNGRRALARYFVKFDRLDKIEAWLQKKVAAAENAKKGDKVSFTPTHAEVLGMLEDVLFTDELRAVLCKGRSFEFPSDRPVLARINRDELGDEDALTLGFV
jgi:hypothetical protein